jgi:hypothetical protein
MAGGFLNSFGLISFFPFSTCHILVNNYIIYINRLMSVVREKLIECSIKISEVFDSTEDALTQTKEGKIISVDILNTKFIRNNIKLFDDTTTSSSKHQGQNSKGSQLGTGV